ncbi:MAG: hypothetical protein ACYS0H_11280 [Planctomycetota bacterium]
MIDRHQHTMRGIVTARPNGNGCSAACPELLTEDELAMFLRIPEVSSSRDHHNVIEHLKRYRGLPRIRICNRVLYPMEAIRKWIEKETTNGN